jgi:antitoxin component YwqK of YwqJK toxin-antitoxin module
MKIITVIIFLASFNSYSQEIEYQLYLKNSCNDSIEKSVFYSLKKGEIEFDIENIDNPIIKVPKNGIYELISEETNEKLRIKISKKNKKDTLLLPSIYHYIKSLPYSFKKNISKTELTKLRKDSRSTFMKCDSLINGVQRDYFTNGKIRLYGNFKKGFAYGEFKEYYQNGNIKVLMIFDSEGFLKKKIKYDKKGKEIEN